MIVAYAVWAFIYFAYSWAASGRTAGMALFGVRVVQDDGTDASGRRERAPGRRADAGAPAELPVPGAGVRRHPREPAPGPARPHRRNGGHLLLGHAGSAAAVPVPRLITQPRPARAGSSSGLVRRLLGHRVGVLDGDPGAFWLDLADRDADLEDSLVVPGMDLAALRPRWRRGWGARWRRGRAIRLRELTGHSWSGVARA